MPDGAQAYMYYYVTFSAKIMCIRPLDIAYREPRIQSQKRFPGSLMKGGIPRNSCLAQ